MIARFYGVYEVRTSFFKKIYLVLMENVKPFVNRKKELYSFDLKGSTQGRETKNFSTKKAVDFLCDLNQLFIEE